jgi:hypothetical protein
MKWPITFAAAIACLWLIGLLLRFPAKKVVWPVLAYLLAHLLRYAGAWMMLQRVPLESPSYAKFYMATAIPVVLAALVIATYYLLEFGWAGLVAMAMCVCFGAFVMAWLSLWISRAPAYFLVTNGALLACAVGVLLSVAHPGGAIESAIKLGFGCYWLAQSAFMLAYAMAHLNPQLAWAIRHQWVPSFVALVAMVWLICKLSGGQRELVRQSYRADRAAASVG